MIRILEKIQEQLEKGEDLVLAVITRQSGSAPRKQGAAMLAGRQGLLAGSVGGGALEAAVLQKARQCLCEKKSESLHFFLDGGSLREDIDAGMICGGEVSVLLQMIDAAQDSWTQLTDEVFAVVKDGNSGYLCFDTDAGTVSVAYRKPQEQIPGVCYLPFFPPERAILFGGGHVAAALAPILKSVGFRVIVMDERPEFAAAERFPDAAQVICGSFGRIDRFLTLRSSDYAVVVTPGHMHDYAVEEQILRHDLAYAGVIGSRRKTAAVNAKLREAGITDEQLSFVHTPIGLSIGAQTPEEIAVSIAAEMIAVRAAKREE